MTPAPTAAVRPATDADIGEIGRVQRSVWEIGYGASLPETVTAALTPDLLTAQWTAAVTSPPSPRHHVMVATERDAVVGFAAFGPDETPDAPVAGGLIGVLLVEPRWGRRGHGSRLLAAATDTLRGDGLAELAVWLYDKDRASRQFYASAGWQPEGLSRILDAGSVDLREIRMHTTLR